MGRLVSLAVTAVVVVAAGYAGVVIGGTARAATEVKKATEALSQETEETETE